MGRCDAAIVDVLPRIRALAATPHTSYPWTMSDSENGAEGENPQTTRADGERDAKPTARGVRLADWLDSHLVGVLGPPPLGPYGDVSAQVPGLCPICAHAMGEHLIDRSTSNAVLHCPAPIDGQFDHVDSSPLNELGMTKSSDRDAEKSARKEKK